jgi:CSLREA domain-containing protein
MPRRLALVAVALIVWAVVLTAPAAQAAITVTTTADPGAPGQCSLREAIQAANSQSPAGDCAAADALPAPTTIIVPAGTYLLNGQLHITGTANVVINGASSSDPSQTTIDAGQTDRVLMIDKDAQATLSALTLTGGRTPDGAAGGCCMPGTTQVIPAGSGGNGGGVYNDGALTLDHVVVKANATGAGGRGGDGGAAGPGTNAGAGGQGGAGGDGGGVYNDFDGTLTLTNTEVTGNLAGHGGNGGAGGAGGASSPFANAGGGGGNGGSGGGVFSVVGNHVVTLTNATISANTAGDGGIANGGGDGDITAGAPNTGGPGGDGGRGGDGGGLAVFGPFHITQSTVSANATGIGGTGGGGGSGGGGSVGGGGQGGAGGEGGGVLVGFTNPSSPFSLTNSTIASNTAAHGGNGGVPSGAGGSGGSAGGIFLSDAGTIAYATIARNQTGDGGLLGGGGARAPDGGGGGLWIQSSTPTASVAGTLFASNTISGGAAQNCGYASPGTSVADQGDNLSFPDSSCPGINGDPALGTLQDNGGPTPTMALGGGSAALDRIAANGAGCPAVDQRGATRPFPAGGLCDIGAFELGPAPTPPQRTLTVTTSGSGSGTVTGSGIDCGGAGHTDCSETVADGTTIALSATPATGSSFTTFTGGGCGAASPCTVTMDAAKSVDAKFNQPDSIVAVTPTSPTPPIVTPPTSPTSPSVTNVTESHGTWREGNLLAHLASKRRPPVGTTFTFALDEQARVSFAFTQRVGGRKVKGRCVAQTRKNHRQRACNRTVTRGTLSFTGHSGTNRVSFQGRISRTKKLKPGRYTLIITATNAAGQHSRAKALRFTIVT